VPILPDFPFHYHCCYSKWWSVLINEVDIVGWIGMGSLVVERKNWVSQILIVDSIYSFTTNLWWKSTFIRSFHSSVFSLGSTPPMRNALYSPFVSRLNPKDVGLVWATHPFIWWGSAERKAGVWHDASWNDLPLDVWIFNMCERVDGSIFISLLTLTYLQTK